MSMENRGGILLNIKQWVVGVKKLDSWNKKSSKGTKESCQMNIETQATVKNWKGNIKLVKKRKTVCVQY